MRTEPLSAREKQVKREVEVREDKWHAREWLHEELQAKHGEVRQ